MNCLKNLDERYYIINDVKLKYGNIDHIVVGPNGVFVIETKNYEGEIICEGDRWSKRYHTGKGWIEYEIKSPSKQAKRNAMKVKKIFEGKSSIWIDAIVVFTSQHVDIQLNNCSIPVLKINEICEYIKNKRKTKLSPSQIKTIVKLIMAI